jgi:hypothetical protein
MEASMKPKHIPFTFIALLAASCANEPSIREPLAPVEAKNSLPKKPESPPGRAFDQEHRWDIVDSTAVKALMNTPWGEQEMLEFWTRKGWHLTQTEDRYFETIGDLERRGSIKKTAHWSMCPFTGVYTASEPVTINGTRIAAGTEFWLDMNENEDELKVGHPLFPRTDGYKEEHEGHVDQASTDNHREKH